MHDALDEACARLLKMKDQPVSGGTPTSVIVTIGLQELLAKAGHAETADGSQLSADQLLRIADEAEIWPTIINHHNVPLALGRTRRLASPGQTMALHIRDSGCSFPGCTHQPSWCDRHHIRDWILGGLTDLESDLALQIPPHAFLAERLDVPDERRRAAGMDPATMDRPSNNHPSIAAFND
jgi:hypothetical protein